MFHRMSSGTYRRWMIIIIVSPRMQFTEGYERNRLLSLFPFYSLDEKISSNKIEEQ